MITDTIFDLKNIFKSFQIGRQNVSVLKDISLQVNSGDFMVIFGPSGCGKSTLLHVILGLEVPTTGTVTTLGKNLYRDLKDEDERSNFRKEHIGMVYQQPNWVQALNVVENVAFPLFLLGVTKIERLAKAEEKLKTFGMIDWALNYPTELSSGQQQKVALARALTSNPTVIIADEPTGNLDYESGQELMEILAKLNQEEKKTIVMVTHDLEYLDYAKTSVKMLDGTIENIYEGNSKAKIYKDLKNKKKQ